MKNTSIPLLFFYSFCLLLFTFSANAQSGIVNKAFFASDNVDQFKQVIELADGGYLAIGTTQNIPPITQPGMGQADVFVIRYDASLNAVWTKILGDAGNDFINGAVVLPDGNFMLAGQFALQPDGNAEGWLVKLSAANGSVMFSKTLGGSGIDMFSSIFLQPDGELILAGFTSSTDGVNAGRTGVDEDFWLLRVSQDGVVIRNKWLNGTGQEGRYHAVKRSSKGFCVRAYSTSVNGDFTGAPGNNNVWLIEVDEQFNILRKKVVLTGNDFYYFFTGLAVDKNDGVYIADKEITYYDSNWDPVWSSVPSAYNGREPWLVNITAHPDGGVLAYGNTELVGERFAVRDSAHGTNGFLERITSSGETKWVRYFGGMKGDKLDGVLLNRQQNYLVFGSAGDNTCDNTRPSLPGQWLDGFIYEWKEPNVIKGKVFVDVNSNLRYDPGVDTDFALEPWGKSSIQVSIRKGSLTWNAGNLQDYFYAALDSGTYEFKVTRLFYSGPDNFTSLSLGPAWNQFNNPSRITFTGKGQTDSIFIALSNSPFSDLTIGVENRSSGAIGTNASYAVIWQRSGNLSPDSVRVAVALPAGSSFVNASIPPRKMTGDSAVWIVRSAADLQMDSLRMVLKLPTSPAAKVGDTVQVVASVFGYGMLEDTTNNRFVLKHVLLPQSATISKLTVSIKPMTLPMPSGEASYKIYYNYVGELDSLVADLAFWQDFAAMDLETVSPRADRVTTDSIIWNGRLLVSGKTDSAIVRYKVKHIPEVSYGLSLLFHASIRPLLNQGSTPYIIKDSLYQGMNLYYDSSKLSYIDDEQGVEWIGNIETPDTWAYQSLAYIDTLPGQDLIVAAVGLARTPNNGGLLLHKSDVNGMVKWRKLYKDLSGTVRSLKALPDGRFAVLLNQVKVTGGVTEEQWGRVVLFDSAGQKLWQRDISRDSIPATTKTWVDLIDLDYLPNGNILVSGSMRFASTSNTFAKGLITAIPLNGGVPSHHVFTKDNTHFAFGKISVGEQGELFSTAAIDTRATALSPGVTVVPNSIVQLDLSGSKVIWEQKSDRKFTGFGYSDILAWDGRLIAVGSATDGSGSYGFLDISAYDGSSPGFKEYRIGTPFYLYAIVSDGPGFALLGAIDNFFGFSAIPAVLRVNYDFDINSFKVLKPRKTAAPGVQNFQSLVSVKENALVLAGTGRALAVSNLPVGFDESRYHLIKLNTSDVLNGFVYFDSNNNGNFDAGEKPVDDVTVVARNTDIDEPNLQTSPVGGKFTFKFSMGQRLIKVQSINGLLSAKPDSLYVFMDGGMQKDSVTFRMTSVKDSSDLQVQLLPLNTARPGFDAEYRLLYSNSGSKQAGNVTLTLGKDARQQLVTAVPSPSNITGDSIKWNLGNLTAFSEGMVTITLRNSPPPTLNNSDSLQLVAKIDPKTGDGLPENNTSTLIQPVKGSFDPNDKTEINNGIITPQQLANKEPLVYLIRFQNTGNDTAFRVYIMDTLDAKLDFSSIEILSSSHPVRWSVSGKGVVQWEFNNILLPDSNVNEKASHGYVSFRIRPKGAVRLGDVIKNTASIYFDFNLPIVTNTVTTTVANRLITSVNNVRNSLISVNAYPNPATSQITVELKGPVRGNVMIRMVDMNGRIVLQKKVGKLFTQDWRTSFDVSTLPSGIYTVFIHIDNDIVPYRIIKL